MTNPFSSGSNPFEFLLGDLLNMLGSQKGMHSEMAKQMAVSVANTPANQPNVEPLDRIKYEELTKILQIHLQGFAALPETSSQTTTIEVVTRADWASRTVTDWDKYAVLLQKVAEVQQDQKEIGSEVGSEIVEQENLTQMIQNLSKMIGPSMIAMQLGSMVGHLAKVAFGSYEIPVPRPTNSSTMISRSDRLWIRPPVFCELFWLATSVATWPARRSSTPAGSEAASSVDRES